MQTTIYKINKVQPYSTRNYILYLVIKYTRKEYICAYIYIYIYTHTHTHTTEPLNVHQKYGKSTIFQFEGMNESLALIELFAECHQVLQFTRVAMKDLKL